MTAWSVARSTSGKSNFTPALTVRRHRDRLGVQQLAVADSDTSRLTSSSPVFSRRANACHWSGFSGLRSAVKATIPTLLRRFRADRDVLRVQVAQREIRHCGETAVGVQVQRGRQGFGDLYVVGVFGVAGPARIGQPGGGPQRLAQVAGAIGRLDVVHLLP